MSRITEIFLRARDTLNDAEKQRWSDATLLRNLNQGITDIAIQSGLFKNTTTIALNNGQEMYTLPESILRLSHCSYNWRPLPLVTSGWMDHNREPDWRYTITKNALGITHVVFDEIKRRQLRVYPRPFGDYQAVYELMDSPYGVTVAIDDYEMDTPYGVIGSIVDPDVNAESLTELYGVLAGMAVAEAVIIYYTECPELPTAIDQDPPIDGCFDTALKYYVCAMALRNDIDTQNRSMANEELVLYQRDLDEIKDLADTDSVSAANFESHYNAMG